MRLRLSLISLITLVVLVGCGEGSSSNNSSDTSNSTREENSTLPQSNQKWIAPRESTCQNGGGVMNVKGVCLANWENANKICRASGGVLPSIEILEKVVTDCGGVIDDIYGNSENSAYQACYKKEGFVNVDSYWSSTTYTSDNHYASDSQYALIIYFDDGDESNSVKIFDYDHGVRCARDVENTDIDNSNNSTTINDGLIAYYKFDGNANDSSGNGYTGTEYGDINYTNGIHGKAVSFEDYNQNRISFPLNEKLQDFTFLFFAKINSLNGSKHLFTIATPYHDNHFLLYYVNSSWIIFIGDENNRNNDDLNLFNDSSMDDMNFHHVAISRFNNKAILYIDGKKIMKL